ncbi:MAG: NTP transferase domain-containing protein [Candidatus Omnitrophica bacterium]|nr:NTP transferase domain-containing protein [Candidatus Omnitrophota bacterium]
MDKNIACIILAAGKGTRMKSDRPKVLHNICGRPMLDYVLDLACSLKLKKTVVVIGHKHEAVKKLIRPGIKVVIQKDCSEQRMP